MTPDMSRYYVLTERDGIAVIEATAVDESHPFLIRFSAASKVAEFDRHDLLWWSAVDSQPPAPFSNLGALSHRLPTSTPGGFPAHPPWHPAVTADVQRNADKSRRSVSALGALVKAACMAVPRGWRTAALELKVSFALPEAKYRIVHRLRDPGTDAEAVDFSESLFTAIEVFHRIEVEGGQNWNRCVLALKFGDDGSCDIELSRENGRNFGPR